MLILFTLFGMWAGATLSLKHIQVGGVCPELGNTPVCFIIFIGYALMLIGAAFIRGKFAYRSFILGAAPVLTLALLGVVSEIFISEICPPGMLGIPQCFYSLVLAFICIVLFILLRRAPRSHA